MTDLYPVGNLHPVTDGGATWKPASSTPAQIVSLGATNSYGKVLRRTQTGVDNTDMLSFPPVSSGPLTVEFDARASTAGSRTLDVFLLPSSGNEVSLLGWGTVSNQLCYYNGTSWIGIRTLDTNWHRIAMINHLSGPAFGSWYLKVDGAVIATNLPWRNSYPEGTAFSRVRFGGIRGTSGTYGEVDNLVVSGELTATVSETIVLTNAAGGAGRFTFSFKTNTNSEYLVESGRALPAPEWSPLAVVPGTGADLRYTNQPATNSAEFYRVKKLPAPGLCRWLPGHLVHARPILHLWRQVFRRIGHLHRQSYSHRHLLGCR